MKKFIIVTDSCSDLPKEVREKYDIEYFQMSLRKGEAEYPADLDWGFMSSHDFYSSMKNGAVYKTSQVPVITYQEGFEKFIQEGYDVLSISCSSALSSSFNGSVVVANELKVKYPGTKIVCIDSRISCMGLGLMAVTASKMRAEGKTIEEVRDYLECHKQEMNQWCTADSLEYLMKAGRVSKAAAFFGGIMQVKPMIISDVNGCNVSIEKPKGRKTSIKLMVERFKEHYIKDFPYQAIALSHCDCEEEIEQVRQQVKEFVGDEVEVFVQPMGPIIGASLGPGGLAINFWGDLVTFDSRK